MEYVPAADMEAYSAVTSAKRAVTAGAGGSTSHGVYICPVCGSKRITEAMQAVILKKCDANTRTIISTITNKPYMSNRDKAFEYDCASPSGVGCWFYVCRKCGWESGLYVE